MHIIHYKYTMSKTPFCHSSLSFEPTVMILHPVIIRPTADYCSTARTNGVENALHQTQTSCISEGFMPPGTS